MARNRMIKVEFWESEKMGAVSITARLFFISLWNFADDYGYLEHKNKWLKAKCFPYDDVNIEELLKELVSVNAISIRNNIIKIHNFEEHQKVAKKFKSDLPEKYSAEPQNTASVQDLSIISTEQVQDKYSIDTVQVQDKYSTNTEQVQNQYSTNAGQIQDKYSTCTDKNKNMNKNKNINKNMNKNKEIEQELEYNNINNNINNNNLDIKENKGNKGYIGEKGKDMAAELPSYAFDPHKQPKSLLGQDIWRYFAKKYEKHTNMPYPKKDNEIKPMENFIRKYGVALIKQKIDLYEKKYKFDKGIENFTLEKVFIWWDKIKEDDTEKAKPFVKPTLEQIKAYVKEKKFKMDAEAFYDHFQSNGWKVGGKTAMRDWQAAVRNWERRDFGHTKKSKNEFLDMLKEYENEDVAEVIETKATEEAMGGFV